LPFDDFSDAHVYESFDSATCLNCDPSRLPNTGVYCPLAPTDPHYTKNSATDELIYGDMMVLVAPVIGYNLGKETLTTCGWMPL
jgi:hypothetical protein